MLRFVRSVGLGALIAYFFDPDNGRRRRALARDRFPAFFRRMSTKAQRTGKAVAAEAEGVKQKATHLREEEKPQPDDVTLARKVETEIFRPQGAPKGKIDVNAVEGVVWLRGEVKNQAQSKQIETQVRAIPEVRGVENLLHLPKTPAPSRTRGGAKKTTTKKATSKRFDRSTQKTTSEKPKSTDKEPLPSQAAATGAGRKTAPLGSKDTEAPATTSASSVTGGTTPEPATGNGGGSGTGSAS
jgi:BON domain